MDKEGPSIGSTHDDGVKFFTACSSCAPIKQAPTLARGGC
jgi:hypothetical protein